MSRKSLIVLSFAASLAAACAFATSADAAPRHAVRHHAAAHHAHHSHFALRWPHPRPIGHRALPVRHGHISVASLPGHHPAYHRKRHMRHVAHKAHRPAHHKAA